MARHKVEICGVNTADIKVLNNVEMIKLFKEYQEGNELAKEELINGNLKLVLSILKKFNNRVDNMDDLFQVGCIGLIKAIDNFDLTYGVKFSTYSVPMILGEIKRYLRDSNSVRISRSIKDLAYKALKLKEEITNERGEEPRLSEIAEKLEVSELDVSSALDSLKETISMSEPIYSDGGDTIFLADQLEDKKKNQYPIEIRIALNDSLDRLREKERFILTERYIVGKTQMELADEIGISQAQISRLEKKGIENLKKLIL